MQNPLGARNLELTALHAGMIMPFVDIRISGMESQKRIRTRDETSWGDEHPLPI